MATVSNLVVKLTADNSKLTKGLKKANSSIGKFATNAIKSAAKIGAAITAGLVGAATAAAFEINKVSKEIDSLAKTALLLNVGVNELQRLQFAAEKAGVTSTNLNLGLQRMTRRLGEAARGGGEAKGALEALGLNIENISKLTADQQFLAIAAALKKVKNESEQLSLAFKFFDSEGAKIVNAIRLGVEDLGKEFDDLNLGITDQEASSVENMRDRMTELSTIIKSIKQATVAFLAPAITEGLIALREYVKAAGGAREITKQLALRIVDFGEAGVSAFYNISSIADRLAFTFATISNSIGDIIKKVKGGLSGIGAAFQDKNFLNPADIGRFLSEAAFNVKNVNESLQFDTNAQQRQTQYAQQMEQITASQLARDQEQARVMGFLTKTRENLLKVETDITKARKQQAAIGFSQATEAAKEGKSTSGNVGKKLFKTKDEFGNISFTDRQPAPSKSVVELRVVGDEAKRFIRAEVREEVEAATRFDKQ